MYLVDTNVILEVLLDQEQADEAERFLREVSGLFLSDFAFHSLGVVLLRYGQPEAFPRVYEDLVVRGGVGLLRLEAQEAARIVEVASAFTLISMTRTSTW